jgi:hypothetical protein
MGDNGHWKANSTMSLAAYDDVKVMSICLAESGAISFLHYRDAGCPSTKPTNMPSEMPVFIVNSPSPTVSPTETPTICPIENTICDFSTLWPGVALSNATQAQRLLDDCSMSVTAINTTKNNPVNVFNSSKIEGIQPRFDPDLGSPNALCPGGGPGRGVGGVPNATFRK